MMDLWNMELGSKGASDLKKNALALSRFLASWLSGALCPLALCSYARALGLLVTGSWALALIFC